MAQRDGKVTTIGDHKYTVYMLPPMEASGMLIDILKVLGPSVGMLLEKIQDPEKGLEGLLDQELNESFISDAVTKLTRELDADKVHAMMRRLAGVTTVEGVKGKLDATFDVHFMGDVIGMYKWFGFALTAQYGNFSDAWGSVSALLPQAEASA